MLRKILAGGLLVLCMGTPLFAQQQNVLKQRHSAWAYLFLVVIAAALVGIGLLMRKKIVPGKLGFAILVVFGALAGPFVEESWFKTDEVFQKQIQDVLSVLIGAGCCFLIPWLISHASFHHDPRKVLDIHRINR